MKKTLFFLIIFGLTFFNFQIKNAKAEVPSFTTGTKAINGTTNRIALKFSKLVVGKDNGSLHVKDFVSSGTDGLSITDVYEINQMESDDGFYYVIATFNQNINLNGAGELLISCAADSVYEYISPVDGVYGDVCSQGAVDVYNSTIDSTDFRLNSACIDSKNQLKMYFNKPVDFRSIWDVSPEEDAFYITNNHYIGDGHLGSADLKEYYSGLGNNDDYVKVGDTIDPSAYVTDVFGNADSTPSPIVISSCICTSFDYSSWGDCEDGKMKRKVEESFPTGCTGGSPDLTKKCELPSRIIKTSPSKVKRGGVVVESGKRFSKNNEVAVYFEKSMGTYYPPRIFKTNSSGKFSISYKIPYNKAFGKYKWYAVDKKTGKKSKVSSFTVVQ